MSQHPDQIRNLSLLQTRYQSLLDLNAKIENRHTLAARRDFVTAVLNTNLFELAEHLDRMEQLATLSNNPIHSTNAGVFLFEGVPCALMINPPRYGWATDMVNWYAKQYAFDPKLIQFGTVPLIPTPTSEEVFAVSNLIANKDDDVKENQNQTEQSDEGRVGSDSSTA